MGKTKFSTYTLKYLVVDIDEDIFHDLIEAVRVGLCCDDAYPLDIEASALSKAIINEKLWGGVELHIMEEIKAIHKLLDYSIDRIELI